METDHILTEMISEKTAFNKIHLGQEIRRRIAAKDAQLKNTESLVAQLTEEVAYGNKVIAEKDAQLKVAIEALKFIKKRVLIGWEVRKEYIDEKLKQLGVEDV